MTEHIHYIHVESPNGTSTVWGECDCGWGRDYPSASAVYVAPADKGGKYRPSFPRIPKDVLADER